MTRVPAAVLMLALLPMPAFSQNYENISRLSNIDVCSAEYSTVVRVPDGWNANPSSLPLPPADTGSKSHPSFAQVKPDDLTLRASKADGSGVYVNGKCDVTANANTMLAYGLLSEPPGKGPSVEATARSSTHCVTDHVGYPFDYNVEAEGTTVGKTSLLLRIGNVDYRYHVRSTIACAVGKSWAVTKQATWLEPIVEVKGESLDAERMVVTTKIGSSYAVAGPANSTDHMLFMHNVAKRPENLPNPAGQGYVTFPNTYKYVLVDINGHIGLPLNDPVGYSVNRIKRWYIFPNTMSGAFAVSVLTTREGDPTAAGMANYLLKAGARSTCAAEWSLRDPRKLVADLAGRGDAFADVEATPRTQVGPYPVRPITGGILMSDPLPEIWMSY